jgi:transcription antitermination factor NusG
MVGDVSVHSALTGGLAWYAVRVTSGRETVAAQILWREAKLDVWLPVVHKWRRYSYLDRRRRLVQEPMLPRYLFLGWSGEPEWRKAFQFRFVMAVASPGCPMGLPMNPSQLERIRRLEAEDQARVERHADYVEAYRLPKIEPGDLVRIELGGKEFKPRVEKIRGRRAQLLLNEPFLGLDRVEADVDILRAAE